VKRVCTLGRSRRGGKLVWMDGQDLARQQSQNERAQTRTDRKRIRELERELHRKEKALAEAAALLELRKKLHALWGEDGDS
jgi:transposase